jgi:transposase
VDEDAEQVVRVELERKTRQRRSVEEKRRIVEATMVPGASIARVARTYEVNANQLFHWRKLYKQGLLQAPGTTRPKLLPVHIADLPAEASLAPSPSMATTALPTIHIDIPGKAVINIAGCEERFLRTVLECLLR